MPSETTVPLFSINLSPRLRLSLWYPGWRCLKPRNCNRQVCHMYLLYFFREKNLPRSVDPGLLLHGKRPSLFNEA